MNKAWVVEFKKPDGNWIPFDIEWTRQAARETLESRVANCGGRDVLRIRRWVREESK